MQFPSGNRLEETRKTFSHLPRPTEINQSRSFSSSSLQQQMQAILDDDNGKNCLIYAPCQVGKTAASIMMMEECIKRGYNIVYSTDNKSDQMDQADYRISSEIMKKLNHMDVSVICMSNLTQNRFKSILRKNMEQNISTIILIMDNESQIQKLRERFVLLDNDNITIPPIALFHDEGDIITKHEDVYNISNQQATSHKAWLQFTNFFFHQKYSDDSYFCNSDP